MTEYDRDFKGVWIPKIVWLDERLNALDKVILTEIDSLDNGERGCYASNKHIAEFCQCSETKVSTAISKLIKIGYLYVQKFDGRQRELKSRLSNFERQDLKNCKSDFKNLKESNTSNNTVNNTSNKKKESKQNSFNKIILEYAETVDVSIRADVTDLLFEWLKVRKAKRAALTDRAIQINIDKLDELARKSGMTVVDYLKEVICRGWAAFYEIKNYSFDKSEKKPQQPQKEYKQGVDYF
jgi:hypothetical protein